MMYYIELNVELEGWFHDIQLGALGCTLEMPPGGLRNQVGSRTKRSATRRRAHRGSCKGHSARRWRGMQCLCPLAC
jgi:hypothetical protein